MSSEFLIAIGAALIGVAIYAVESMKAAREEKKTFVKYVGVASAVFMAVTLHDDMRKSVDRSRVKLNDLESRVRKMEVKEKE